MLTPLTCRVGNPGFDSLFTITAHRRQTDLRTSSPSIKLAEIATQVEAACLLTNQAAEKYECGERCDPEAGMAGLFASAAAMVFAQEAMRIHGGYGYSAELDIERYARRAADGIGEGTNEIQRI